MDNPSDEVGKLADKLLGKLDSPLCLTLRNGSRYVVDGLVAFLSYPVEPVQPWLERWVEGCLEKADHSLVPIRTSGPVPLAYMNARPACRAALYATIGAQSRSIFISSSAVFTSRRATSRRSRISSRGTW